MRLILVLWLFLVAVSNSYAHGSPTFQIITIQGAQSVEVKQGSRSRFAIAGEKLNIGDLLITKIKESVEIEAEDQSRLIVAAESHFEVTENEKAQQTVYLYSGKLLGWAKKMVLDNKSENQKIKYRFLVKTKSAVMGVRGTQFVVDSSDVTGKASFHILEGAVDIAKDLSSLLTDNFVVATTGQLVSTAADGVEYLAKGSKTVVTNVTDTIDSGIHTVSAAMPFDVVGFVADLNSALPSAFHIPFLTNRPPPPPTEAFKLKFHLSSFEFYSQGFFSRSNIPDDVPTLGLGLSWNPTLHVVENKFDLRAHFGNPHLFQKGHGLFGDWEFKLLGSVIFKNISFLDFGPILQRFYGVGTGYGVSTNFGLWHGDHRIMRLIDRLFFGVNMVSSPYRVEQDSSSRALLWEFRFGAGFTVF